MKRIFYSVLLLGAVSLASCDDDDEMYTLQQNDIEIISPEGGFVAQIGKPLKITPTTLSDKDISYQWLVNGKEVSNQKTLEYTFDYADSYELVLKATQNTTSYEYKYTVKASFEGIEVAAPAEGSTAYITQVFDYMPAIGQFTNELPKYEEGDTQEDMNKKVLASIGNHNNTMITLGGYGGYVVVGFDHTIQNVEGKRDFRVLGNAFYAAANPDSNAPEGGSCEPGIIMVAYDANKNGKPDENEWYEIAGSSHEDVTKELWYDKMKNIKDEDGKPVFDMNFYFNDFEITYYKPEKQPATPEEMKEYVKWEDNKGNKGYKEMNNFHRQCYYPLWVQDDKLTFKGSRLPQNGMDESGAGSYFVLYKFRYGYADNEVNNKDESAIDISWAVNSKGEKVHLPGVDFIKVYNGVNQENGWLGECSTEVTSVEDLHILKENIDTRK